LPFTLVQQQFLLLFHTIWFTGIETSRMHQV